MLKTRFEELRDRNEQRKQVKAQTSAGPWYFRRLDDEWAMNLVSVSTSPGSEENERWPNFDRGEIVAATLVQQPQYVSIADDRHTENALFIAFARNDNVEADVDELIAEIERLQATLNDAAR